MDLTKEELEVVTMAVYKQAVNVGGQLWNEDRWNKEERSVFRDQIDHLESALEKLRKADQYRDPG